MTSKHFSLALVSLCAVASAQAADLSATMTVDNTFVAYLSTDPNTLGTSFLSGNNWPTTYTGSATLADGATSYLTIVGTDLGSPAMFIGQFSLTGGATFAANGGTTLLTGAQGWQVSSTGANGSYGAVTVLGPNGTSPWSNFTAISPNAQFIWDSTSGNTRYFRTEIRNPVPEPTSCAVLGLGAAALLRRRRKA